MDFEIEKITGDSAVFKVLADFLDTSNHMEFFNLMTEHSQGLHRIIIDLKQLHFLDSSGISELMGWCNMLSGKDCQMCVCNAHGAVKETIGLINMQRVVKVFKTRQDAVEALCSNQS